MNRLNLNAKAAVLAAFFWALSPGLDAVACTPISAEVIGTADDAEDVYFNGTFIGTFGFVNAGTAAPAPIAIPVGLIQPTGNVVAVLVRNTAPSAVLGSFAITVACASGERTYFSSDDIATVYFDDSNSSPLPLYSGFNWTQPGWVDAGSQMIVPPVAVTAWTWNKPAFNPQTGQPLTQWGRNASGTSFGGSDRIYFRGIFDLTPEAYVPPSFTITKTINSGVPVASQGPVNYTLHICNIGAATNDPVIIRDDLPGGYMSSPSSFNGPPAYPFASSGSDPLVFTFADGFAGYGACYDITYTITAPWFDSSGPCTLSNIASVEFQSVTHDSATATANTVNSCGTATPTRTPTRSFTQSATPTTTPTRSATLTATPLPGTPTHTPTLSPFLTPTSTPTWSASPTLTATVTASATATPSPSFSPSPTLTATRTATATFTAYISPTITPTFSISPTRYVAGVAVEFHGFYPNPFDKEGSVYFSLRADAEVNMNIYNVAGEIIHKRSVALAAGKQILVWKGENQDGGRCASGVYVIHVKVTNIFNESGEFWTHAVIAR